MRAAHGAMSTWAPELVVLRSVRYGYAEVLLTRYAGGVKEFSGMWHIPGGYGNIADESLQAACSRIAKREFGIEVNFVAVFERPYLWRPDEHPYGRPLSLYCRVCPLEEIIETDSRTFFSRGDLPANIVPAHRRFILKKLFP